jgi:hypothetical protein
MKKEYGYARLSALKLNPAVHRQVLQRMLKRLLKKITAHASMRRVEAALGLSPGYLYKLKSGRSRPSVHLISTLGLLAVNVKRGLADLERMQRMRGSVPK